VDTSEPDSAAPVNRPAPTAERFTVSVNGFDTGDELRASLGGHVRELSRYIDLTGLDGVTVAADYKQALLDLDRGYTASQELKPSEDFAVSVAMTPTVMRNGTPKSHIVLDARFVIALEDTNDERFGVAFQLLAHECAHVEITRRFDGAFPGVLLQERHGNAHDALRWQIISSCWDEYAATWIAAGFGHDPTEWYEQTFLSALSEARGKANDFIKAYRRHGNEERVLGEVYDTYGTLMRAACYHLGNMAGCGRSVNDLPQTKVALEGHWFAPQFERLGTACKALTDEYVKSLLSKFRTPDMSVLESEFSGLPCEAA
jgi:hypothetical protein